MMHGMAHNAQLAINMPRDVYVKHQVGVNEKQLVDLLEEQTCEIAGMMGACSSITEDQLNPIVQTIKELAQLWKKQTMISKRALLLMYDLPGSFESWASMYGKDSATYNSMIDFTTTVYQELQEAWETEK